MTINDYANLSFLLNGFKPSEDAVKSTDTNVRYYGFLNSKGEWYIQEFDTSAGANSLRTYRYARGTSGYTTAWTNRESLTYDYFNEIFG